MPPEKGFSMQRFSMPGILISGDFLSLRDEIAPTEFQRWLRPKTRFDILALCPNFAVRSRRSKEAVKRVSPLHTLKTLGFIKYSQPSMFFSISPDLERVTELEFRQVKK